MMRAMDCTRWREALSARIDGEVTGVSSVELDHHLARCAGCREYEERALSLNRAVRVAPAAVPDLSREITDRLAREPAPVGRERALRWCLGLVALLQLSIALPSLLGVVPGLSPHDAHHVGAFALSVAGGFAYVAWRPGTAHGLLPVIVVLVVAVLTTSTLDAVRGVQSVLTELSDHAPELIGLVLVWLLTRSKPAGLAVSR